MLLYDESVILHFQQPSMDCTKASKRRREVIGVLDNSMALGLGGLAVCILEFGDDGFINPKTPKPLSIIFSF